MVTQSQVALQAIALVKALTELHNQKHPLQEFKELPPDNKGNPSWMTFCPAHEDINTPSLHVSYLDKILVKCRAGCTQDVVINKLKDLQLWNISSSKSKFKVNIPAHAEPEDVELMEVLLNDEGVTPDEIYSYRTEKNEPVFWVLRANTKPKIIKPYSSITYLETNQIKFAQVHIPNNRPLYNLPQVTVSQRIMIVEGEKTAEKARKFFNQYCITTWAGGTGAVAQTNWETLKDKEIILWPDNDIPGIKAMEEIAKKLLSKDPKANIKLVFSQVQAQFEKGWDLADAELGDNVPEIMLAEAKILEPGDLTGPIIGDLKEIFDDYNKRLIPVTTDKDVLLTDITKYMGTTNRDIPYLYYPLGSLKCYARENQMVELLGARKPVYAIDEWAKTISDKLHWGVNFDPSTPNKTIYINGNKVLNIFAGFPYEPKQNSKSKIFEEHIKILLDNNEYSEYLLDWIAHIIQYPADKPGTFILLKGPQGTGKTLTANMIEALVGERNSVVLNSKIIQSNFNGMLSGKLFVSIDELYFESVFNKRFKDEFKSLVTTNTYIVNPKYGTQRSEKSFHRFFGTTNHEVPITIDFNSRRETIFPVASHRYVKDIAYFQKILNVIYDPEALAGWMYDLSKRKITHDIHTAFDTKAKLLLQAPDDPIHNFIYQLCLSERFPIDFNVYHLINNPPAVDNWPMLSVRLPRSAVTGYIKKAYNMTEQTANTITSRLLEILHYEGSVPTEQRRYEVHGFNNTVTKDKDNLFVFPPLPKLRELFCKYKKINNADTIFGTITIIADDITNVTPISPNINFKRPNDVF